MEQEFLGKDILRQGSSKKSSAVDQMPNSRAVIIPKMASLDDSAQDLAALSLSQTGFPTEAITPTLGKEFGGEQKESRILLDGCLKSDGRGNHIAL